MRTSIAIVGGGPAGCAAALTLRRYLPNVSATLVTRPVSSMVDAPAVGETLSPGVLPLLNYLGLREEFLHLGHLPSGGTASAWGSGHLFERNYLFTGQGHGWHLDRSRFDAWLLSNAEDADIPCIRSHALRATRSEGFWRIELEGGRELVAQCDRRGDRPLDMAFTPSGRFAAEGRWTGGRRPMVPARTS